MHGNNAAKSTYTVMPGLDPGSHAVGLVGRRKVGNIRRFAAVIPAKAGIHAVYVLADEFTTKARRNEEKGRLTTETQRHREAVLVDTECLPSTYRTK
jgi:hypothetical protein